MMELVVTVGAISHSELQSNRPHQQTNTQFFYRPDALPVTQPTVSKHSLSLYLSLSLSLSLSLRFNGHCHFPGEPGLAGVY